MSNQDETTRPQLSPEEQQDLAKINQYADGLNKSIREFNRHLKQIATEYSEHPALLSYVGRTTIAVACSMLYRLIPEQFHLTQKEIEEFTQANRDVILAEYQNFLHTMPYADYLQTEHWQTKRREALERALHRCQVCYSTTSLNVHHRTYERRGNELPEDLIVLCQSCHQLFHDNGKLEVER